MKGYCVKCKAKREMIKVVNKKTKNGRNMKQGSCKKCGTKMSVFVK